MARENAEFDHASLTSDFVEEFVDFDLDSLEHQDDPPEETFNEEPETPPQPVEEPDTAAAPDSPGTPPSETEPQTAPARKTDPAGPPLVAVCGTEGGAGTTTVTAVDPAGQVAGERLLEAADAALYDAKSSGRGVWRLAGDPTISPDT